MFTFLLKCNGISKQVLSRRVKLLHNPSRLLTACNWDLPFPTLTIRVRLWTVLSLPVCVCVCVCICMSEREKGGGREREVYTLREE